MKRQLVVLAASMLLSVTGCTQGQDTGAASAPSETSPVTDIVDIQTSLPSEESGPSDDESREAKEHSPKILIAYFTRLDNTEAELEEILQGGGPYGPLGSSLEDADLDAVASASIQLIEGEVQGSTEAVARMIQEQTGGELFSIRTAQTYPVHYDTLIDQGGEERNQGVRPELISHVENMEEYDVVFLGFPNWWYDMPMAVYSFLEAYDFSGKTVIPFVTSASSGFSGTIDRMKNLMPEAAVVEPGFAVRMGDVPEAGSDIAAWLEGLEY